MLEIDLITQVFEIRLHKYFATVLEIEKTFRPKFYVFTILSYRNSFAVVEIDIVSHCVVNQGNVHIFEISWEILKI